MDWSDVIKVAGVLPGAVRGLKRFLAKKPSRAPGVTFIREGNWRRSSDPADTQWYCLECDRPDGTPLPLYRYARVWHCRRCKVSLPRPDVAPPKRVDPVHSYLMARLRARNSWVNRWRY